MRRKKRKEGKQQRREKKTTATSSGSVGMGSMGCWETINFWAVGSGTHHFWKERTKIYPSFSGKQARNWSWDLEIAFGNPSFQIPNGATARGPNSECPPLLLFKKFWKESEEEEKKKKVPLELHTEKHNITSLPCYCCYCSSGHP